MTARADPPAHLYQAVLDRPDDDAARLECADWYEREDQPLRARFIRLQCEAAAFAPGDARALVPENDARSMIWANRKAWLGRRPEPRGVRWHFLRGFPEHVQFDSFRALEEHRDAVFEYPVRRLSFTNLRSVPRLARCDVLESICQLDLRSSHLQGEGIRALADSPYLSKITWLDLGGNGLKVDDLAALV